MKITEQRAWVKKRIYIEGEQRVQEFGTVNIRGINSKENKLKTQFVKFELGNLWITVTKKAKHMKKIKGGNISTFSIVNENARAGVGCIISVKLGKNII